MKKSLIALMVVIFCFASNLVIAAEETQIPSNDTVASDGTQAPSNDAVESEAKRRYLINVDFNEYTTEDLSQDKNIKYTLKDGTVKIIDYVDVDPESYIGNVLQMDYDGETSNYMCFPLFYYNLEEAVGKGKVTVEFDVYVSSASNVQFGFTSGGATALAASFSDRKITLVNMDATSDFLLPERAWTNVKMIVDYDEKIFSVIVDGEMAVDSETFADTTPALEQFCISAWPGGGKPMTVYCKGIECYTEVVKKARADDEETIYTEPVGVLKGIGILKDSDDYSLTAPVSRGYFAQLMTRAMGISEGNIEVYGETKYSDVGPENPYKRSVGYLDALGWIHSSDGKFYPNDTITFAQAAKWMTYLIGYDVPAEKKGGYPIGYISVLNELDVTEGLRLSSNTVLTEGDAFVLLANLLEADIVEPVAYGDKVVLQSSKDNTALWKYFNAYKIRGVVTATEDTGLATINGAVSENQIQIDGKNYLLAQSVTKEIIGRNVTAYIQEDRNAPGPKVVYLRVDKNRNKLLQITDNEITSVTESGNKFILHYTDEKDRIKSVTLSKDAYYLYNGAAYGDVILASCLNPLAGDVLLIDNNTDSVYDVISINNYTYMAVKSVDSILETIYGQDGEALKIDKNTLLWDGEKEIAISSLSKWDVLQICEDRRGKLQLCLLSESVRGTVETIGEDEVVVDGETYKISPYLNMSDVKLGENLAAVLDTRGRICFVNDELATSGDIGYVIAVGSEGSALSGNTKIKILAENGSVNVYDVSSSFRYNDVRLSGIGTVQIIDPVSGTVLDATEDISNLKDSDKIIKLLKVDSFKKQIAQRTPGSIQELLGNGKINPDTVRQLVKYKIGKDKTIISIDTESLKVDKPVGYGYAYSYDSSGRMVCNYASIGTSGVPTFIIPPEGSDDEDYRTVDWGSYGDKSNIYPEAYNMSASLVPEAMIFYGIQTDKANSEPLIVERVYVKRNKEGEYVRAFDVYERSAKKTYLAKDDSIGGDVRAGDIIQVGLNANREVEITSILLSAADNPEFIQDLNTSSWMQFNYGILMGTEKGGFAISTVNDGTPTDPIPSGIIPFTLKTSTKVYLFDLTSKELYIGTSADVENYTFDVNPDARVAARAETGALTEVFIFFH